MNKRNSEWLRTLLKQTSTTSASKERPLLLTILSEQTLKCRWGSGVRDTWLVVAGTSPSFPPKHRWRGRQGRAGSIPQKSQGWQPTRCQNLGGFPAVGLSDSAKRHSRWLRPRDRKSEGLKKGKSHFVFFVPAKNQTALLWLHGPCF